MRFTVSSSAMADKLAAMAKVMNSKAVMPILSTFLVELKEGELEITASDMECVWHGTLPVTEQEGTGKVCISASTLLEAVRNLPEQPITFTIGDKDKCVDISYANGRYAMAGLRADEYPQAEIVGDIHIRIEANSLCKAIGQSLYAVSNDPIRPVMTGVNFTIADGKMECAASDGHKLVLGTYTLAEEAEGCRFLLSAKAARIVKALVQKQERMVEVEISECDIVFKTDTDTFSARLIDGLYPNYNAIIPTSNDKEATIDRQALLSAIRRVGVFAEKASRQLVLSFSGMALLLSGHDFDNSTSAEETVFCGYKGGDIRIAFHAENLKQVLENMDAAEVRFRMSEACRAAIVEPVTDNGQEQQLALLMPMMLPE